MKDVKRYFAWFKILGIALFVLILTRLDLKRTIIQLSGIQLWWLVLYAACQSVALLSKSARWGFLLKKLGVSYTPMKTLAITSIAGFYGSVTPGRIGEFSKVVYLKKDNISVSKTAVSIVLDRFYDLAVLCLLGVAALLYFAPIFFPEIIMLFAWVTILLGVFLATYFLRKKLWELAKIVMHRMLAPELFAPLSAAWESFRSEMASVFKPTLLVMVSLTLCASFFSLAQVFFLARALGIAAPFLFLAFCVTVSSLVSLLPVSIGGLGTREATFIVLLGKISISAEAATLLGFLDGAVLGLILSAIFAFGLSFTLRD